MEFQLKINMIKFYLHTPELPNWQFIFYEIVEKIAVSGLLDAAGEINLCINGNLNSMLPLIEPLLDINPKFKVKHVNPDPFKWEWPSLNAIKEDLNLNENNNDYIGYGHLKGLSRANTNDLIAKDWRDYLVYWTIERWSTNVTKLEEGYDGSGVNWFDFPFPHFSGNFWWATSKYLRTLTPLQDPSTFIPGQVSKLVRNFDTRKFEILTDKTARFESEAWVGSAFPAARMHEIHASPSRNGYNFPFHYNNRYPPNQYREDQ